MLRSALSRSRGGGRLRGFYRDGEFRAVFFFHLFRFTDIDLL